MEGLKGRVTLPSLTLVLIPKAKEMASPPKCQLWSLSSDCQELPQAAMLTPPQDSEMDVPDVDTQGPGT